MIFEDATSINAPVPEVVAAARNGNVKGLEIGVIEELNGEGYQAGVRTGLTSC
jgi:aspartyl-tRNA(Asn)/glutamyl-tRNA(Gln) amidotransferase subunit A